MERLWQDLINQSKLIESRYKPIRPSSRNKSKVHKIFTTFRGGADQLLFTAVEYIKRNIIYLLISTKKKSDNNRILNLSLSAFRFYMQILFMTWQVEVNYYVDKVSRQSIIMTVVCGGTTGFVVSWIGVGTTLVANVISLTILGRSAVQQLVHNILFKKLVEKLIHDKKFTNTIGQIANQIEEPKQKLKELVWEQNLVLKQAAERLGICEEKTKLGPIKSTGNSMYTRYQKKLEKIANVEPELEITDFGFVDENQAINIPRIKIKE